VTARLDLVFADGPFSAEGASRGRRPRLDPPYYEWCQFVGEDFLSCRNLDGCFAYLEELMGRDGPFDGLLGFSQGAGLSAALAGLQQQVKQVVAVACHDFIFICTHCLPFSGRGWPSPGLLR
jgi:hypothetical protein